MNLQNALCASAFSGSSGITFVESNGSAERISYKELFEHALRMLGGLQRFGLRPKDEMVIQLESNRQFLYAFWACILGGIYPIPLSTGTNDERRTKLLKVWKHLSNPFLICDAGDLSGFSSSDNDDIQMAYE